MTPDDRITYTAGSHLRPWPWPPLIDWLRANGIDPAVVRAVTYTAGRAHLEEYVHDAHGRRTWRKTPKGTPHTELIVKLRAVAVTTPIPIHPDYYRQGTLL